MQTKRFTMLCTLLLFALLYYLCTLVDILRGYVTSSINGLTMTRQPVVVITQRRYDTIKAHNTSIPRYDTNILITGQTIAAMF